MKRYYFFDYWPRFLIVIKLTANEVEFVVMQVRSKTTDHYNGSGWASRAGGNG